MWPRLRGLKLTRQRQKERGFFKNAAFILLTLDRLRALRTTCCGGKKKKKSVSITDDKSTWSYKHHGAMWANTHLQGETVGSHTNMQTQTYTSKHTMQLLQVWIQTGNIKTLVFSWSCSAYHCSGRTGQPTVAGWLYWVTLYECEAGWCWQGASVLNQPRWNETSRAAFE